MAFNLFKKRKKEFEFPEKSDIEIPPAPSSIPEEDAELPTFPSAEEAAPSTIEDVEKDAVRSVEESLEERESLELKKPLFIEARLYKGIIDDIGVLKTALKDNADKLTKISNLKDDREKNYSFWHKQIEDIQRKLIYADDSLFGK